MLDRELESSDSFSEAEGISSSTEVPSSAGWVETDKFDWLKDPLTTVIVESFPPLEVVGGGAGTWGGGLEPLSFEIEGLGGKLGKTGVEVVISLFTPFELRLEVELVKLGATLDIGLVVDILLSISLKFPW